MRLESLGAVHTSSCYKIIKKEINKIYKRELCKSTNKHKQ